MGCSSCKNAIRNSGKVVKNLVQAAIKQPDPVKWFRDGVSGVIKCISGKYIYSDEDIVKNREVCRTCEFSSKTDGKLTISSQCQAIDPATGTPCQCFILCKTAEGKCPLKKWTHLTINGV
jgi:hypothetical protein